MKKSIYFYLIFIVIFNVSCSKNGEIFYRPVDENTKHSSADKSLDIAFNTIYSIGDTEEVFIKNNSSHKLLRFTIKKTVNIWPYNQKKQEPEWENVENKVYDVFVTLEPGAEKSLDFDKFVTKQSDWNNIKSGYFETNLKYFEADFKIVGVREITNR